MQTTLSKIKDISEIVQNVTATASSLKTLIDSFKTQTTQSLQALKESVGTLEKEGLKAVSAGMVLKYKF